ncbi:ABC transporter ATP-binding protein [Desulfovibrio piger]|uniref:ABC transporter ATP-binding protein n=1 Tax=Desulfovibrio piger TaxID=901 RepID=UPI00195846D3|nr:ABC transporter ATP-binding protein [Desulfovibrio piger]MBM6893883.1 ABC transporter ATP-binding protein [Desulfovibrio piger]
MTTASSHKEYTPLSIARQLYSLATPQERRLFWWLCLLNIFMGLFEIGVAGGISLLGVAMSAPESLARYALLEDIRVALPFSPDIPRALQFLLLVLGCICAATLLKNVLLAYITWLQNYFSQRIAWTMGSNLFRRFLAAPHIWHAGQNSAELLTVLGWKVYVAIYATTLLTLFTQMVIAVFLLGGALIASPLLSCLLFASVAFLAVLIQKGARARIYNLSQDIRHYDLYNSRVAMQGLQGLREIAIYDKKQIFLQEYQKVIEDYSLKNSSRNTLPMLPMWVLEVAGMLLLLLVLLIQVNLGSSVAATTGTLTLLAAVSWRLLPAANKTMNAILAMRSNQPLLEKLLDFMAELPASKRLDARSVRHFQREISLHDVCFTYPDAEHATLQNISLTIPKGSMVGLVGLSGSGKSTLTSLITGLLRPQQGQMCLDGKLWNTTIERLNIGYVPQNLYLLDATLAENVAFSHWGEPVDEERVRKCCRMAAMDFIDDLPEGIHTPLGERGVRLSGGQIQRVGIARALYDRPELLIFDEATSALDGATERAIQSTIESLRQHVTLVVVAHRLSTVEGCDLLYWIDKGTVAMQGKSKEVLAFYKNALQQSVKV